jgi:hypothetical protein
MNDIKMRTFVDHLLPFIIINRKIMKYINYILSIIQIGTPCFDLIIFCICQSYYSNEYLNND